MESIDLRSLNLTIEESRNIINFIAQKRGISTEKLLSTIKSNLKRKNNEILTTKTQQDMAKTQQKLRKSQQNMVKTQQNMVKTQQKLRKSQQKSLKLGKRKTTQNLTYEKPSKLAKRENLTSQKQQIMSKNKKKKKPQEKTSINYYELHHKLSKSDLKKLKSIFTI